ARRLQLAVEEEGARHRLVPAGRVIEVPVGVEGPVEDGAVMVAGSDEEERFAKEEEVVRGIGVGRDRGGGRPPRSGGAGRAEREGQKHREAARLTISFSEGHCHFSVALCPKRQRGTQRTLLTRRVVQNPAAQTTRKPWLSHTVWGGRPNRLAVRQWSP